MYKILVDSCGDFPDEMKKDPRFAHVPLTISIDDYEIVDDESFDQADWLERVDKSPNAPKSACPSPGAYIEQMEGDEERIYIVTLSARLSGSYNSACLAKSLFEEDDDNEDKKVYVFDSKSASIGETLIAMKIAEYEEKGMEFDELVEAVEDYIRTQHTFFCLETLDHLRKAGRLSNLKAMIAGTLNIKPIMGSTDEGDICQLAQARGMNRALEKMAECMISVTKECENRILAISHCNAPDVAAKLKEYVEKVGSFKDIFIVDTAGVSSLYAADGGVIMVV